MKSNTSGNELGDVNVQDNLVKLLPHEMGIVLEVCVFTFIFNLRAQLKFMHRIDGVKWKYSFKFACAFMLFTLIAFCFLLQVHNNSEWWMLVAQTKQQIEHTVRTMYQQGTVYNNNINSTTPFGGATSIENATVVRESDIQRLPGALLLLPPKSARSVVIQYSTNCYDSTSSSSTGVETIIHNVSHENLLWAAVDLSRNTVSEDYMQTSKEGELHSVLSNLRYGEVITGTSSSTSNGIHDITTVKTTTVSSGDCGTDHTPVNLNSESSLIATLLSTVPQITLRTHLYEGSAASELVPHIKDAHLGDLYSLRVCQFYDLSIAIRRCDVHNASNNGDMRVELGVIVIQNEAPVLYHDCDDKQMLQESASPMTTSMRPCVMTGKPYCSYKLHSAGVQKNSEPIIESADSISSGSVVHKLRLCFAYGGSYSVFPLVRVTAAGNSSSHNVSSHTTNDTISATSSCVGGSWWTATDSYIRVVAK